MSSDNESTEPIGAGEKKRSKHNSTVWASTKLKSPAENKHKEQLKITDGTDGTDTDASKRLFGTSNGESH